LAAYWRIDVRQNMGQIDEILQRLEALDEVDLVYKELAVSDPGGKSGCDPRVNPTDDPYFKAQGYLEAAPLGIDARWVWNQANGVGEGVALIDLEQGWILDHEDLACKSPTLLYGDNRHGVGTYRGDHGAAVLGEVVAVDNRIGVVGIAPGVTSVRVVSHYDAETGTVLHVADAIVAATNALSAGDVLLLEVQRNYLPTEVDDVDFEAIRLAVARGIIVVEAAGNGGDDLDNYTNPAGERILNRTDSKFRESGAIMVGAAQSPLPHDRASFSNYGSRIDCYGWGENIVTCGYGNLDAGFGESSTYTNTFGGTSGASPMVTGAALLLQGMYQAATGKRLSPTQMRELLSNPATGTPQGRNVAGHIGVMPNLRAIVESRRSVCDWA
jgi:subtilisin family serine protease